PGRDEKWKLNELAGMNNDLQKFAQEQECEFQGSSGTLIAGWKLKELVAQNPITSNEGLKQYEQPVKDHVYSVIVDVSRGKGLDYSAFSVIDITSMPYKQVCTFKDNFVLAADYASTVYHIAKTYNNAYILVEINDLGDQVAWTIHEQYEYENILMTENGGRNGKKLSSGFGVTSAKDMGVRTTKPVKSVGCSMIKMLIEQNQLVINDLETISELSTFSKKKDGYEAEPGKHDDLVMGLVLFAWMTNQSYFKELTNINTLVNIREKSQAEVMEDMAPFGFIDDHQSDPEENQRIPGWFMPLEHDDL
ncbi:MAG: terminase, partial [Candidatus Paceibacteria bacterium]